MKLLFVYRYLTFGGVETVIRARMQQLDEYGVEAWCWFLFDGPGAAMFSDFEGRVLIGDTPFIRSEIQKGGFIAATTFDTPEVIQFFDSISVPIFVESHSPYQENLKYLSRLKENQIAAVLAPTLHQSNVVQGYLQTKIPICIVSNAIAAEYFDEITYFKAGLNRPAVGWVGRMDGLKNWKGFLDVGKHLADMAREIELIMIGNFPNRDSWYSLYRYAKKKGLLDRLRWIKSLQPRIMPGLYDYLRQSGGVLVSTSKGDSFGMSVAEAMARACPVVVPREPPFVEFVEDGKNGIQYSAGDYLEAARAITFLLDNKENHEQMGSSGKTSITERFSSKRTSSSLLEAITAHRERCRHM